MTPGLSHVLIALALQAALAVPVTLAILHAGPPALAAFAWPLGVAAGACFAMGFHAGRERRQSEEFWGSNRIPPWIWKPRALRDLGWPALAVLGISLATGALHP